MKGSAIAMANAIEVRDRAVAKARWRKVTAMRSVLEGGPIACNAAVTLGPYAWPDPRDVEYMTQGGREALATLAGVNEPSDETWRQLVVVYRTDFRRRGKGTADELHRAQLNEDFHNISTDETGLL